MYPFQSMERANVLQQREVCIVNQDLIIAVDGSGSLQKDGFIILRNRFGQDKVGLGLVPFGNDVTMPDGKTISPAINP